MECKINVLAMVALQSFTGSEISVNTHISFWFDSGQNFTLLYYVFWISKVSAQCASHLMTFNTFIYKWPKNQLQCFFQTSSISGPSTKSEVSALTFFSPIRLINILWNGDSSGYCCLLCNSVYNLLLLKSPLRIDFLLEPVDFWSQPIFVI